MTVALAVAIAQLTACFSEYDWERFQAMPPLEEVRYQCCNWSWHKDYLQWLKARYPRGKEDIWIEQCRRPLRFWELLQTIKEIDTPPNLRIEYLIILKEEFPHYWYGKDDPPKMPQPMVYGFPRK